MDGVSFCLYRIIFTKGDRREVSFQQTVQVRMTLTVELELERLFKKCCLWMRWRDKIKMMFNAVYSLNPTC